MKSHFIILYRKYTISVTKRTNILKKNFLRNFIFCFEHRNKHPAADNTQNAKA